jgi:hypothetical protein
LRISSAQIPEYILKTLRADLKKTRQFRYGLLVGTHIRGPKSMEGLAGPIDAGNVFRKPYLVRSTSQDALLSFGHV